MQLKLNNISTCSHLLISGLYLFNLIMGHVLIFSYFVWLSIIK